jgi:uncharacterized protein YbjT (DUF2867 family)
MILVTAANGRTGRSVIRALARKGARVRAFDIEEAVETLAGQGADEVCVGDLLDSQDVARAMSGVQTVIHIGPPMHPREAEMGHQVVTEARRSGVRHLVQFSVTHPQLEPLLNHQAKLAVERVVLLSRLPFTILQPMHYMQNIDIPTVVATGLLLQPYALNARLAHVDLEDVAEVAAAVVGDPDRHRYATYELCGTDFCTANELAEIVTRVSGRPVTAQQVAGPNAGGDTTGVSEEEDHRHDALARLFEHYGRYGITGNPNVLAWLLERPPTRFEQYVRRSLTAG